MKTILSTDIPNDYSVQWAYNGLDSCLTLEIANKLKPMLDDETAATYAFELELQAPILEMMLRGILIDRNEQYTLIDELEAKVQRLRYIINLYAEAIWGFPLNPNSPKAIAEILYGAMKIPPVILSFKGVRRVSTNREALEKCLGYFHARPLILAILKFKDLFRLLGDVKHGVDQDGYIRSSYNIGGTDTGRLSCSKNAFGTGSNTQNRTERMRKMYTVPPGYKMAYLDLEQAESRAVAYISGDEAYIEACESGDLHTTVARMIWPKLKWTDDPKHNKKHVAGEIFYREMSYRDLSKRGGHGTNYYGTPWTMARHLKVDTKLIESFQGNYFSAFPGIRQWHTAVALALATSRTITTAMARKRVFFGRSNDDATLRAAIAYEPQSTIVDILNTGMLRLWKWYPQIQILAQVHDAVLFQYPEALESELIPAAIDALSVKIPVHGRTMLIPVEASVGWNWHKYDFDTNPNGIKAYDGNDNRTRIATSRLSILHQQIL